MERRITTMPESSSVKTALRRQLLANRQGIAAEVRRRSDRLIGERLLAWLEWHPVDVLGVYWPIRSEPDLSEAYDELTARGVTLALPVVVENNAPLRYNAWTPGEPMQKDAFGVAIPVSSTAVAPQAILVPCVGFNCQRFRLGYGGGFYDRTLATEARPLAIGIAYTTAMVSFAPDIHDISLDVILTESLQLEAEV
ncbi:5-formyltetrahydrofolate cyclo-ligase [Herbaspirillum sp. GCM10030257]|uniref:5-formyltetrahydrofolate cyclo-ligase n=1 Tax=Herbaspirillum sp. GCM10030257 TaxID=3273393 RepID=UPI00360E3A48